jgi:uncharacterized membrane protein
MLNEERIILMTHMASYEMNEGKKNEAIGRFFRSDYIAIQVLKSIVSATIAYGILFGLYVLYNFETLMGNLYQMDLIAFAQDVLIWYAVVVVVYAVISYLMYSFRYFRARKSLKTYYNHLKKLNALYSAKSSGKE